MSKIERDRRVTMTLTQDGSNTTLKIDVDSIDEDMPHEHRRDLRETAEDALGMPLSALPEHVRVELRRKVRGVVVPTDDHDHEHGDHTHIHVQPGKVGA